jgi:hypothetical protein
MRAAGVRCSIDDFGTVYSALTYLAEMPIDAIKIDRSFVQQIDGEGNGAAIVGAVIALAHSLDLVVVAEGVETDAQLKFLDEHDCDQVQGFRFCRPILATELSELMHTPAKLFTDWGREVAWMPDPVSGVSPARLEALLESIMLERRSVAELDTEAIEAVLAALQSDDLSKARTVRAVGTRSAEVAASALAGLASVPDVAAGALAGPVENLAARMLDQ